jgi:hypothetical protein
VTSTAELIEDINTVKRARGGGKIADTSTGQR